MGCCKEKIEGSIAETRAGRAKGTETGVWWLKGKSRIAPQTKGAHLKGTSYKERIQVRVLLYGAFKRNMSAA